MTPPPVEGAGLAKARPETGAPEDLRWSKWCEEGYGRGFREMVPESEEIKESSGRSWALL